MLNLHDAALFEAGEVIVAGAEEEASLVLDVKAVVDVPAGFRVRDGVDDASVELETAS